MVHVSLGDPPNISLFITAGVETALATTDYVISARVYNFYLELTINILLVLSRLGYLRTFIFM